MSITAEMIDAMVAAGLTQEQMATVMKASLAAEEAKVAARRAKEAEKKRKQRANKAEMSRDVPGTDGDIRDSEKAELGLPPFSPLPSPQTPKPSPLYPPSTPLAGGTSEGIADAEFVEIQAEILPFPTKTKEPAAARASRLPKDFSLTAERLAFARKEGLTDEKSRREFDKFADHHGAKGTRFVDWDRAWQNWVRKAADGFGQPVRAAAGGHGAQAPSMLRAYQRAAARFANPADDAE